VNEIEHADALDFLARQEPSTASAVIFDPPYRRNNPPRGRYDGAAGKVAAPFSFMDRCMKLAAPLLQPGGIMLIFGDAELLPDLAYMATTSGLRQAGKYYWDRGIVGTGGMFRSCVDEVLVVSRGAAGLVSKAAVPNIVRAGPLKHPHPYAKPPEVYLHALQRVCRPGDLVVDPFAGSGTSREAAEKLGLQWRGADIDPQWAETTPSTDVVPLRPALRRDPPGEAAALF